jgi:hypothetical protein
MNKLAILAFMLAPGATVAALPVTAVAAETHSNCATFDNNGNIISVTPNCTQTIQQKGGQPMSMAVANPCNNDPGILTLFITSQVFHVNVNGAGDLWLTATTNGQTAFVPDDPNATSGTGHWTSWFGGSLNKNNSVFTDTYNLDVHFTNGQTVTFHVINHMSITPGGVTSTFSKGGAPTCH